MFKFYFDNELVNEPYNWFDFQEVIERDEELKVLLPKYETKLNFGGKAYQYLYSQYVESGYCKLVNFRADMKCGSKYETILNGFIFISDVTFNLNKCIAECPITDNNYAARIYNNKSIKTKLDSDKSKNGTTITPCETNSIRFLSVGQPLSEIRDLFNVKDAFRYLIDFMSDGTIGFESDYLTALHGEVAPSYNRRQLCITTGSQLQTNDVNSPLISFKDLFNEVYKKYPIGITIINVNGKPTIKLEQESYFYNSELIPSANISNINDLLQSFDNERLYSNVKISGAPTTFNNSVHTFVPRQWIGFSTEEYFLTGECNIDKTLDLQSIYRCDSNIIEEILTTSTTEFKDDIIFVDCTLFSTTYATGIAERGYDNFSNDYYYNPDLTNEASAKRHKYNGDLTLYNGINTSGFKATKDNRVVDDNSYDVGASLPATVINPDPYNPNTVSFNATIQFNNDSTNGNYDNGGYYNNLNGRYYAHFDGDYYFRYLGVLLSNKSAYAPGIDIPNTGAPNMLIRYRSKMQHYSAGGTLIAEKTQNFPNSFGYWDTQNYDQYNVVHEDFFTMTIGEYVSMSFEVDYIKKNKLFWSNFRLLVNNNSVFTTTISASGGGVYSTENTGEYLVSKYNFKHNVSNEKYKQIKEDITKPIIFDNGYIGGKVGFIRKSTRTLSNGEMNIELISNLNLTKPD